MIIEVKDLKIGDEVLTGSNSSLKYIRILSTPRLHPKKTHWRTKDPLYRAIKYSTRQYTISYIYNGSTYHYKNFICTHLDHNKEGYIDLNHRTLWLVNRK